MWKKKARRYVSIILSLTVHRKIPGAYCSEHWAWGLWVQRETLFHNIRWHMIEHWSLIPTYMHLCICISAFTQRCAWTRASWNLCTCIYWTHAKYINFKIGIFFICRDPNMFLLLFTGVSFEDQENKILYRGLKSSKLFLDLCSVFLDSPSKYEERPDNVSTQF